MPRLRTFLLFAVLYFLLLSLAPNIDGGIRFTNLRCFTPDKSWIVVYVCRLRAKRRDVVTLNIDYDIVRVARTTFINIAVMKKANGYKPFLYNIAFDACEYWKRRNNPVFNLIFKTFRNYSTFNHSCPYTGNQKILDYSLKNSFVTLPMPSGEYAFFFKFYMSENIVAFNETTDVGEFQTYFELIE